ncbi:hypothetical protein CCH79_00013723 [Gambusia affinis]|uniref:Fibronectin type-III domain-containing protein n=1 Tax=Gambusia affinis TaxID=33528 RepID=A0A315VSF2_GAMAF|nr:hypothetical protein CCH79_00013723 [Gambusia affinis]
MNPNAADVFPQGDESLVACTSVLLRVSMPPHLRPPPSPLTARLLPLTRQQRFPSCCQLQLYGGTMGLWTPLLLLLHLAVCVSLPAPANVSITSYNMEHILRFWPDPRTPPDARFTVQIHSTRKQRWKTVVECAELTAGQTCNLTSKLKDMFDYYLARVQALRTNQTSNWTSSNLFHPLEDSETTEHHHTDLTCFNKTHEYRKHLIYYQDHLFTNHFFRLKQSYQQETVISYLQPGVEYCVSVSFKSFINRNSVPSEYRCAFTSPPPPQHTCTPLQMTLFLHLSAKLFLVLGLLGGFTLLVVIFVGRFIYSSKVSLELLRRHLNRSVHTKNTLLGIKMAALVKNQHLPSMKFRSQSYTCLMSSLTEEDGALTSLCLI